MSMAWLIFLWVREKGGERRLCDHSFYALGPCLSLHVPLSASSTQAAAPEGRTSCLCCVQGIKTRRPAARRIGDHRSSLIFVARMDTYTQHVLDDTTSPTQDAPKRRSGRQQAAKRRGAFNAAAAAPPAAATAAAAAPDHKHSVSGPASRSSLPSLASSLKCTHHHRTGLPRNDASFPPPSRPPPPPPLPRPLPPSPPPPLPFSPPPFPSVISRARSSMSAMTGRRRSLNTMRLWPACWKRLGKGQTERRSKQFICMHTLIWPSIPPSFTPSGHSPSAFLPLNFFRY